MKPEEYINSGELEFFALGLADKEQAERAEQMILNFQEVATEYERIAASLEEVFEPVIIQAPTQTKANLFAQINSEYAQKNTPIIDDNIKDVYTPILSEGHSSPAPKEGKYVPMFYKYVAAASVVIALVSLIANVLLFQKYQSTESELVAMQAARSILANEFSKTSSKARMLEKELDMSTQLESKKVMLAGLNTASKAKAAIFWNEKMGMVQVRVENMPDIPSDKDLQLWAIVEGKPVDLGIVKMDGDTSFVSHQLATAITSADAFAFTLEDKGGHPQPQGEMWLIGNING